MRVFFYDMGFPLDGELFVIFGLRRSVLHEGVLASHIGGVLYRPIFSLATRIGAVRVFLYYLLLLPRDRVFSGSVFRGEGAGFLVFLRDYAANLRRFWLHCVTIDGQFQVHVLRLTTFLGSGELQSLQFCIFRQVVRGQSRFILRFQVILGRPRRVSSIPSVSGLHLFMLSLDLVESRVHRCASVLW